MRTALALALLMLGCQSTPQPTPTDAPNYGLLYALTSKQQQVGMLLIIKRNISEESASLVRDIADASKQATQTLESLADENTLKQTGLPALEQATRDAIEADQRKILLGADEHFEFRLLLTQSDATQYARFLAEQLAERAPDETTRKKLTDIAETFMQLNARVIERLQRD